MPQARDPRQPTRPYDKRPVLEPAVGAENAEIMADQIEAGYDIQADASTRPMGNDPGSTEQDEPIPSE